MKRTLIIAEAGVNHNGSLDLAYKLIDAAKFAGVDIVKFQTFKTEKIVSKSTKTADYQKENLGGEDSQFDMIKKLELSYEQFTQLRDYCQKIGIEFLSTPDEEDSLHFLADELDLPWIKIGSGEVNNLPFLRMIAAKQKPIILSTGMSTLGEVETAVRTIREVTDAELILLHCTTNYPCPMEQVNLRAMQTLAHAFNLTVGYSDHTLGIEVPVAAVAMGAAVIEKHFTLDKSMEGPDHLASLDPQELKAMVDAIRNIEQALGDGIKRPNATEEKTKQIVRKRLVASQDLPAGKALDAGDFELKRANEGIFVENLDLILGKILRSPVACDTAVRWSDLMESAD